jgi:hypothetical protein
MTAQTPVVRTSFRVYRTNDGRTLVEHPTRIDSLGMEPTKMLVISDSGISVGEKKLVYPTSTNAIVSSQEIMGIMGILELTFGSCRLIQESICWQLLLESWLQLYNLIRSGK